MKKILVISGLLIIVAYLILYFISGGASGVKFKKIDSVTSKMIDTANGYEFLFPSKFKFVRDYGGTSWISQSIDDVQLVFWDGQDRFCREPGYTPPETRKEYLSKTTVNGYTVYKDLDLADWNPSLSLKYEITNGSKCLVIIEQNKYNNFFDLDKILQSVKFK